VLELADIEPYLRDRGLISARAVVDGGFRVVDVSRLNRVFIVTAENERCLVLKCGGPPGDAGVAREAEVLQRLRSMDGEALAAFMPAVVEYDAAERVLVLETEPEARDLARHHAMGRFSRVLARQAGEALARLHEMPPGALRGLSGSVDPTWTLRAHKPDWESTWRMSGAAFELTRVIQSSDELCTRLDDLLASWSEQSVIHGDVRWDNCIAMREAGTQRWNRLRLVDWEHSAPGDPSLDTGAFLGEYLRAWLQSIPIVDPEDPGRLLGNARLPLGRMRPAVRAFWDAYTRHRRSCSEEFGHMLHRATLFAASSVLTIALEQAQTLAELRPGVLGLVHLSENILRRPETASAHLLGLGPSRASA
jgi:aminoglycoside phosphotransferase (APT) family kinase protein